MDPAARGGRDLVDGVERIRGCDRGAKHRGERKEYTMGTPRKRHDVEQEIKETIGLVPSFFDHIPDEFLDAEWYLFKRLELGETRIPNKYKELMGIAIHAESKCQYCTLFHTEAAKLFGASAEEIQEAAHYAKMTLGWSAYLNGIRQDHDEFAKELHQIGEHLSAHAST
jgi:AhpD family alkylhydroperoxidase